MGNKNNQKKKQSNRKAMQATKAGSTAPSTRRNRNVGYAYTSEERKTLEDEIREMEAEGMRKGLEDEDTQDE